MRKGKRIRLSVAILIIVATLLAGAAIVGTMLVVLFRSMDPDTMFGDQHLKTTVAIIELHRVRNGTYPKNLADLRDFGSWDRIAIGSVRYCPSADLSGYYIEVTRGWIGKPTLEVNPDFWRGTGYRAELVKECR